MRVALLLAIVGCAAAPHPHGGGRMGIHGMVVVGHGVHYFEHIPMFQMPHDRQLVLRVELRDHRGALIDADFGATTYTFEPSAPSSLDDLARVGATLAGAIHRGSFERGGEIAIPDVTATVSAVVLSRPLPGEPEHAAYVFGTGADVFVTGAIGPDRTIQQIFHATGTVDARDTARRLPVADGKLVPGAALAPGFAIGPELWCVVGPDFSDPCP